MRAASNGQAAARGYSYGSSLLRSCAGAGRLILAPLKRASSKLGSKVPLTAFIATGGWQLYRQMPRLHCEVQSIKVDHFFLDQSDMIMTSKTLADALQRNRKYYGWCVAFAQWGKYLFALGLALVGSFAGWYFSKFQRQMADRLWPAFIFGAVPMLVAGVVGRIAAAVCFVVSTGYGYYTTMTYWEAETVTESVHQLSPLFVDKASVTDLIGDWGNNLRPHLESYEITTPLFHFECDKERRIANAFVFGLAGSMGQAVVRVFTELQVADKAEYEKQVDEFLTILDDYSSSLVGFLQPFKQAPGPYPSIPQLHLKSVDPQYVDVVCIAGPQAGKRLVLVNNMHKYANCKDILLLTSGGTAGGK